jgi:hypothetical protein
LSHLTDKSRLLQLATGYVAPALWSQTMRGCGSNEPAGILYLQKDGSLMK